MATFAQTDKRDFKSRVHASINRCLESGCSDKVHARLLCSYHYYHRRFKKLPLPKPPKLWTVKERVLFNTLVSETGCLLWQGHVTTDGYGKISARNKSGKLITRTAHRVVYEMARGPIPKGLTLDHLCRVRNCVNPNHLEPVSAVENVMRGTSPAALNAKKTHCHRGHPFSKGNTWFSKNSRICRKCVAIRKEASRAAVLND